VPFLNPQELIVQEVKSWKTIGFLAAKPGKLAESLPL
jgi:hypothetical protein